MMCTPRYTEMFCRALAFTLATMLIVARGLCREFVGAWGTVGGMFPLTLVLKDHMNPYDNPY